MNPEVKKKLNPYLIVAFGLGFDLPRHTFFPPETQSNPDLIVFLCV